LKQLQLIQILRINAENAAPPHVVGAKVPGVNRTRPGPKTSKTPSGDADTGVARPKRAIAGAL